MTIKTWLLGAFVAAGFLLVPQPEPVPTAQCVEDMQCWDCTTMGNQICGPDTEASNVRR